MSDRYLVQDKGYQVIDMLTGELFTDIGPATWVNVPQEGVVAMEQIWAAGQQSLADLGASGLEQKKAKGPKAPG